MKRIGIIVGHEPTKSGATSGTESEYSFNNKLAPQIATQLMLAGDFEPVIIYRAHGYNELPKEVNKTGVDIAISLHCNAFNTKTSGCEVLYYGTSSNSRKLASALQHTLVVALGNKSRGAKGITAGDRGGSLLQKTSMPCVISEAFFIDNQEELANANKKLDKLAKAYADAVKAYYG